ncbi:MAG TPA: hypothetical protein VKG25_09325 [Bryobacteraceae bacterium]|nr:hypothetical protein [Bryobacteraceae bacterium]
MTLSPYTLVHSRRKEPGAVPSSVSEALKNHGASTVFSLTENRAAVDALAVRAKGSMKTVGIWDLGAWVGGLPDIVKAMNEAQSSLLFFEAQASLPAGITSSKRRVVEWSEATLHKKLTARQKRELTDAIIDVDFFEFAKPVRKDLGVDYLIGLSPDAVAGEENDEEGHVVHSDFFCSFDAKTSLVSTVGLRELAEKAQRKFEFAIGFVIVSIMFSQLNGSRVGFHPDKGCLMDYNFNRETLAARLAEPSLCEDCVRKSKPEVLEIARALLKKLDKYPRAGAVRAG